MTHSACAGNSSAGGLVAFPTDTVYGVGALAFDGEAIESIYTAKDRPIEKAIPVLIGDMEDLDKVANGYSRHGAQTRFPLLARTAYHPRPKKPNLPESVSATSTVGVRVPDHEIARALLRAAGPMAVTSANISGQASPSLQRKSLSNWEEDCVDHRWRENAGRRAIHTCGLHGD